MTEGELDRAVWLSATPRLHLLVIALSVLSGKLRQIFTDSLGLSTFPLGWKEERLVLLQKEGSAADSPTDIYILV